MIEFTWCPGTCGGRVRVWPSNGVNFCCVNCWKTYWEAATWELIETGQLNPEVYREPQDYGHSGQCIGRQKVREGEAVIEGEFQLMNPTQLKILRGQAKS